MKRLFPIALFLAACIPSGPAMALLVNPKTGERITCRAVVLVDQFRRENCVQEYEGLGFVQAQNLTPEQRDNLPPNRHDER